MLSSFLLAAILWTGEVWDFLSFTERYPNVIYNIMLFGVTSALGQVGVRTKDDHDLPEVLQIQLTLFSMFYQTFIFLTVVNFGPLTCSIVTTTRKFFTILGSVLLFGNAMTTLQWTGTILVFLGEGPFTCCHIFKIQLISVKLTCYKTQRNPSDVPVVTF